MKGPVVTVLYEDQRARNGDFALHRLLVALAADVPDAPELWEIAHGTEAVPKKGVSKLLRAVETDADRLVGAGGVVAVIDDDKIRHALGLPLNATQTDVRAKVLERSASPELRVCFLNRNLESVLDLAVECGVKVDPETRRRAINGKKQIDRDLLLRKAAADEAVRREMVKRDDSLREICDTMLSLLEQRRSLTKC